jgi:glycine cleavage system H protein
VTEINDGLSSSPERVNDDPYGEGWMIRVRLSDPAETDDLMDADTYEESLN